MSTKKHPHPPYDLVVMAASYGGVHALREVPGDLPADFPVPVAIVQHRSATAPNLLPQVLGRRSPLPIKIAEEGETMQAGTVYLAPPDTFKGRVIAVVLTGGDSDATDGVQSVKAQGGMVIAQDEATSLAFGMPGSAIATGCVDQILPLEEIAPALCRLVEPAAA